jgi:peptidase E
VLGTILALGGGGFSMEPENPLLDDYLLSLSRSSGRPRICFVPTASGDADGYVERFEEAFGDRAETSVLRLFRRTEPELRDFVLDQDIVFVGGGNTVSLLAVWRSHGLDRVLGEAAAEGVVLAGISAGMNCWFEASVTDSYGVDRLDPLLDGLGLLAGSACPHYDGEEQRRPCYREFVGSSKLPGGYAVDDGCALLFRDGELATAVSSRRQARAFRVELSDNRLVEEPLEVHHLGS